MTTSVLIIRYKKLFIPFAFIAMAIFRLPLFFNQKISFYKLMGSGKNGSFDAVPDLQQWAILWVNKEIVKTQSIDEQIETCLGSFIKNYISFFKCEKFLLNLNPTMVHGEWDGKKPMENTFKKEDNDLPIAVLTRATIRLNKAKYFWQNVAPATESMLAAEGFIFSLGIGEIPWLKQATLSVWQSETLMKKFAYGSATHAEIIKKTKAQNWYSEEMFARFQLVNATGTIKGKNPLEMML